MDDFCKEQGITRSQLYYHRARENKKNGVSFHPIKLNSKDSLDTSDKKTSTDISIGKASIHIFSDLYLICLTQR